jgi:hypothetical protein
MYMPRKYSKRRTNKMKGGCGCSNQPHDSQSPSSFFSGGSNNTIKGGAALGPASFTQSDSTSNYTYPLFDVTASPLNANQITDARQLPNPVISGGKKRTRKSKKSKSKKNKRRSYRRSYRKYKGGSDEILKNYDNNLLSKSNTIMGAYTGANIVSANTTDISKPFSTPPFL